MNTSSFLSVFLSLLFFLPIEISATLKINPHGYWEGKEAESEHKTDFQLAQAIANFFISQSADSIADFGCGMGEYVKVMIHNGLKCEGFDGNPDTLLLTDGLGSVLDLSHPFDLNCQFDWVMSLEVGEHLPKEYEDVFLDNLDRHAKVGIVLTWALKGQGGYGHFNEQDNEYIKEQMIKRGYENDLIAENILRNSSSFWWFKNTVMVFRRF